MPENLTKEKIESFDRLIKSFGLAMTNSALYPPNHPVFNSSMKSFKDTLDKWLVAEEKVELGISSDNILLNGAFVKEDSDLYREVAACLHKKGLIAVCLTEGIGMPELLQFFGFLKNDVNVIAEKGGIAKNIGTMPHLMLKEVDYSSLLTSAKAAAAIDEKAMWRSLSGIGKELKKGRLPKSKAEFMAAFLKNPKKAAAMLNMIYKEALAKLDERSTAEEIGDVFSEMNKYFENNSAAGAENTKKEMVTIMSNLDPGLVVSLFKDKAAEDGTPDLADELFKGFPDDMIADFIASLMQSGNNVTEKMIRLFNRLVPGREKSDGILPMVTDKLFDKKLLSRNVLSALQNSIKDLFETHPDDDFIAQIYDLTVGAFIDTSAGSVSTPSICRGVDKDKAARPGTGRYSALTDEYYESLKEDNLRKEKVRLLLNILWLETDAARFEKAGGILVSSFREILAPKYIKVIKEVFELLAEKLKTTAQMDDPAIASTVKNALDRIGGEETVNALISFIPGAGPEALDDIVYVLSKADGAEEKNTMFEILGKERAPEIKKKLLAALVKTKDGGIVKKLFDSAGRGFFKKRFLLDLVTLCGTFKVEGSLAYLKRTLGRKPFINTKAIRALRVQSVLSLGRIGTPEAIGVIEKSANDSDKSVRAMCRMVLESGEERSAKARNARCVSK